MRPQLLTLSLIIFIITGLPFRAASDQLSDYEHVLHSLSAPPLSMNMLPAIQQNAVVYIGSVVEMTGRVDGIVEADSHSTILLSCGSIKLSLILPDSQNMQGQFDTGMSIRTLVRIEDSGNATSLSNQRVLALVPEPLAAEYDRGVAIKAEQTANYRSRRYSYPSRSLNTSYSRSDIARNSAAVPAVLSPRAREIYTAYRDAVHGCNYRLTDTDVEKIATSILYYCDHYNIDPRLVVATVIAESDFDPKSTSHSGAMGLGQIMPDEARGLGISDPYDPIQNIGAAVHLLRGNLDKYGGAPPDAASIIPYSQLALCMAAYNAGPGAVRKYHGVPPYRETIRYVARVNKLYRHMCGVNE